ncbi:hypothetical protein BC830DRAFT_772187 [Chytriomyces sp. MP71]|nr:hypothetical protein BC830DRAFT_772187 [Chytriomyces sp. MP71]
MRDVPSRCPGEARSNCDKGENFREQQRRKRKHAYLSILIFSFFFQRIMAMQVVGWPCHIEQWRNCGLLCQRASINFNAQKPRHRLTIQLKNTLKHAHHATWNAANAGNSLLQGNHPRAQRKSEASLLVFRRRHCFHSSVHHQHHNVLQEKSALVFILNLERYERMHLNKYCCRPHSLKPSFSSFFSSKLQNLLSSPRMYFMPFDQRNRWMCCSNGSPVFTTQKLEQDTARSSQQDASFKSVSATNALELAASGSEILAEASMDKRQTMSPVSKNCHTRGMGTEVVHV